jgi:hypothetical protein
VGLQGLLTTKTARRGTFFFSFSDIIGHLNVLGYIFIPSLR